MKRLLGTLLLLAACSSETPVTTTTAEPQKTAAPPPNAAQALQIVGSDPALAEHEFTNAAISIPVAGSSMSEPTRKNAQELAAAGWIQFDGTGDVMLSEKSGGDRRFLLRENGILDIVPLAKKEVVGVSGVRTDPDGAPAVDFTWRWVPNEVGATLKSGPVAERFAKTHEATATLIWDGTSWSVLKIEKR